MAPPMGRGRGTPKRYIVHYLPSKEHVKALDTTRKNNINEWRKMILRSLVLERKRDGADREKIVSMLESLVTYLRTYTQKGVVLLPRRAFLAHMKYIEGYDSDEAEEEWTKVESDPQVKYELDEKQQRRPCLLLLLLGLGRPRPARPPAEVHPDLHRVPSGS